MFGSYGNIPYLCNVKISERLEMSLKQAAYFYAQTSLYPDRNRVGLWKQPKASL